MPATTPEDEPTLATPGLPVAHVPPPASVSVVVEPGHISRLPEILPGAGFTVIVFVAVQPPGSV